MFEKVCIVSVSGGKDSTLTLALAIEKYRNTDVPVVALFCDTGWEHPLTYEYLNELEKIFQIKIHRLEGIEGGMIGLIRKKKFFPSPRRRVCTQILKILPQKKFYENLYFAFPFKLAEIWIGIRRDESLTRKNTEDYFVPAGQKNKYGAKFPFDVFYHYPIKHLTTQQVFAELKKRQIPANPLYSMGLNRVGCYPCFLSKKEIIQLIRRAMKGDKYSVKRLQQMVKLDVSYDARFHISYSLGELIKMAENKNKQLELFV